jgi:type VII secretion protein EssB
MDNIMKRSVANSELTIPKGKRGFLLYKSDFLVPCQMEETAESVHFIFDTEGLDFAKDILTMSRENRLRFLINCADFEKLFMSYDAHLSPSNLMIDINLRPRIIMRDIKADGDVFLSRYKALIGTVLQGRSYEDYLGFEKRMYKRNTLLKQIAALENANDIKLFLLEQYKNVIEKNTKTKILVRKSEVRISRGILPVMAVLLAVAVFSIYTSMFQTIPHQEKVISANQSYVAGDYLGVTNALSTLTTDQMDVMTKYILARSFVRSEGLTDEQRETILRGLVTNADAIIFDFWIYLGRLDFNSAIDMAGRLGDDDLLLFTYMKQEIVVRHDTSMSGDEKTALLNDLENKIRALVNAR